MEIITNYNISENDVVIYIMEVSGKAFCELSYYKNELHNMFLSNLNVEERYRRKGLASELIAIVSDMAKKKGSKYLYLDADMSKGKWLLDWYKRIGFVPFNTSDNGDLVNMYKIII